MQIIKPNKGKEFVLLIVAVLATEADRRQSRLIRDLDLLDLNTLGLRNSHGHRRRRHLSHNWKRESTVNSDNVSSTLCQVAQEEFA